MPSSPLSRWSFCLLFVLGCASTSPPPPLSDRAARIDKASSGIEGDPLIEARRAGVEAARAREEEPSLIDELQVRIGEDYADDEHDLRLTARIPVKRPGETRAQREVLRAETEMAISRLEVASLERRAELCFPSVDALAYAEHSRIFASYLRQQDLLLAWNEEWQRSGMVNQLRSARFELEAMTHRRTWKPSRVPMPERNLGSLPQIGVRGQQLVVDPDTLRQTVGRHHPSVGLLEATAERYRALAGRAQARRLPGLKFFDVSYEHRTDRGGEDGIGGKLAFTVPLGTRRNSEANRYQFLAQQESSEARAFVNEQMKRSLAALVALREFEAQAEHWRELAELASEAERIAEQWRLERLTEPASVAALLDEAFAARRAIVEARERAGIARCTLLAMTGVSAESWPRE